MHRVKCDAIMPETEAVCQDCGSPLTFETMLSDPLVRMLMEADGVSLAELVAVLQIARDARPVSRPPP